jgi:Transposase DDE domain
MLTSKSPRKVLKQAHQLALACLPDYTCKFSRQDFTLPQLFACLVLKEHQKKSYRGVEALLADSPPWLADIGLTRAPDHTTLCRAFGVILKPSKVKSMLDVTALWGRRLGLIDGRVKPVALDSSMFESHHVSRHFEKRQRQSARQKARAEARATARSAQQAAKQARKRAQRAKREADLRRSRTARRLPKLSMAVAAASHLILAATATTGSGGDQPFFGPLLREARRRASFDTAVADAGYDSEENHRISREEVGVRSVIPPKSGRPTDKAPSARYRRLMKQRFARKADKAAYGQRWQAETVNSMIKRNLGSALRASDARRRSRELLLRVLTHNVMIVART